MDLGLTNKIAFVAGSSRGIGQGIAAAFLREGARVVISGKQPERLETARAAFAAQYGDERILAVCGDLTQPEPIAAALEQTYARWGGLDCLIANIGSGSARPGWQLNSADWDAVFQQNMWAGVRLVEAALPRMLGAPGASVTLIGSIVGLESLSAPLTYSAAKAALLSYSKNLARLLAPDHVRVNYVAPGNILFPGGSWERRLAERPDDTRAYIGREVPMGRFGTPDEIADVVVFLASERASFVTGAQIVADGGQTRGY